MNKVLLKKLYALSLLIIFCFAADRASASHAMASDLTYKCLGGNTYEITLSFYRDCAGIPAPNNPVVDISSTSCAQSLTLTLSPIAGTGQEVTPRCSSTVTTCQGGTAIGIQQWVYTGIITLPMQCTDWTFSYLICCRNAAITTINNPGTSTIYIAATLNNTIAGCHNSPVFGSKPVPFCCVGQPYCFSQSATAEAGDSLVYQLITPLTNAHTNVTYIGGYTATQPLSSNPPVSFNTTDGEICMTPQLIQVTVMAVLVLDYQNGVLVGSVERDMQIIVMNCNNNLPWLSGINGTNVFNMNVCAGSPFCFNILSNDIDTGQTLTVKWSNNIPGATFSSAGNPHPTATFCWTPADSDISANPYCFTATVTDNACPFNGTQTFTYCITVGGVSVNLGPDQQISCTDLATIYATVPSPDSVTYLWSTGDTTHFITAGVGTYWCTVSNGTCTATDTVVITSPFAPTAAYTHTIPGCWNNTVNFTDHSTSGGGSTITAWTWNFGDGSALSNQQNPTHTFPDSGSYYVQLLVMNSLGCLDSVTDTIVILPHPTAAFTYTDSCLIQLVTFTDQSAGGAISWNWNFGDGQTSTSQNPSHLYTTPGSYNVKLIVKNSSGCTDTASQNITVNPPLAANFTTSPVCLGAATVFNSTSTGAIISWHWNFGNGDSSAVQNPTNIYDSSGTFNVTLIVTAAGAGCVESITKPVTVYPLPTATFTAAAVCQNNPTSFLNTSTISSGSISSYTWYFGDGGTSNQQNPNYTYGSSGSFNATLIVTSSNGCVDTIVEPVTVHAIPVASAGTNQNICLGDSTVLTASGGGNYLWNTGSANPSITVKPVANATYTVTVTNGFGCTSSATVNVNVNPVPVANAGPDKNICVGSSATLTANGGGSYSWSNGGVTKTITVNPVVTTNYIVTVTNGSGCQSTDTAVVTVHALPTANAGVDQTICSGATAILTGNGGVSYHWNPVGSSNQAISVNPVTTTAYYLTVTDAFGCSASDTVNVLVNPLPVVTLSPALICSGVSATLDAGNAGSTFLWTPNREITQTISVSTAGNYGVTVTNALGCTSSAMTTVSSGGSVTSNPVVATICQGQSTIIDAGNPGAVFLWSTGATTQTITVDTAGTYNVTVTSPGGCSSTVINTVNENASPVVSFISAPNCLGNSTPFTDQSSISSGNIVSWNWNFGDGQSSNLQNPMHNYLTAGTFNVTLQVNGSDACATNLIQPVTINPLPVANFSTNAACDGGTSFFTDLSTVSTGNITSWNWTFGDGQTSNVQTPQHNYATTGNYNATLIVLTNNGCVDTMSAQVDVNSLPIPGFTASDVCQGLSTVFNNTSTITSGSIASYSWNFGDGNTSALQQPSHQYLTNGSYTVTLTTTSNLGCTQSVQNTINVLGKPTASFATQNVCNGSAINFTDQSIGGGGGISSWSWNFSDGSTSNSASPSHLYNSAGTYNVQLTVTSADGCKDSITNAAVIYPQPNADFTFTNVCQSNQNVFTNLSSIASGNILSNFWTFGDGANSLAASPQHTYSTADTYTVVLIIASDHGCIDTVSHSISVFPLPSVAFTGQDVCLSNTTQFVNNTTVSGGVNFTSSWDFGDGDTSTVSNPIHSFLSNGAFNVSLTAISANGCISSLTKQVNVYPPPAAAFTVNNNCFGTPSVVDDKSLSTSSPIVAWEWDFGDSTRANGKNATHTYSAVGQYNVSLTVTSSFGCKNSVSNALQIYPLSSPSFTAPNVCEGLPVSLVDKGDTAGPPIVSSLWTLGDGTTSDSMNVTHIYPGAGTFNVSLQTTNQFGCTNTALATVEIYPKPNTSFSAANECAGTPVNFQNKTTVDGGSVASYNWNFGNNFGSSSQANPTYSYSMEGTYTVQLNAVSDHGCANQWQNDVTIYPLPNVIINGISSGCSPLNAELVDSSRINSGSIVGWLWDFGDGDVSTRQFPNHIYTHEGNYVVTLTVSSDKGCVATGTGTEHMVIYPSAKAGFTMNPANIDLLNPVVYFTNLSSDYSSYTWYFGDGSTSNVFSPSHLYKDTGDFTVVLVVNNTNNCPDTAMRRMDVNPISTLFAPNAFTPNGDGKNDVWQPVFTDMTDIKVWIYNRWGEMLTTWEGLDGYWDGVYKGHAVQEDVYVYQIEGTGVDGKFYKWTGDITVVR